MSSYEFIKNRLRDLEDNLAKNLSLLKEYELALLYEDDPRRKEKYRIGVEQVRAFAQLNRREYDDLQQELQVLTDLKSTTSGGAALPFDPEQISKKLNSMQNAILGELRGMRTDLIDQYSLSEQTMVQAIVEHFDQSQLVMVEELLSILETNEVPQTEMKDLERILQEILTALPPASVPNQEQTKNLLSRPESNITHKLKLSLPIIPAILSYEGEFEIGQKMQLIAWVKSHLTNKKKSL